MKGLGLDELSVARIKSGLRTSLIGRHVVYCPSVGSTNDVAKELAEEGAPEGTLVIADEQTAGRGRLGRRWLAPKGSSLLMSLLFRPPLTPHQAGRLTMICSLAIADAIEEVTGLRTGLKWPNDILLGGRKAGGILTELGTTGERLDYAIVGVGLNVNLDVAQFPEIAPTATSLSRELGQEVPRLELLWAILAEIEERYLRLRAEQPPHAGGYLPHEEWAARLVTLHQQVRVTTPQGVLEGWAEGVDADGALILLLPDGRRRRLLAGDVTLRTGPQFS